MAFTALVLGLDVAIITLQSRRVHAAETLQAVLTKKNASLQSSVNRLSSELRDAQAAQAQPLASEPKDGAKYIPVRLDAIKAMNIKISGSNTNSGNDTGPWVLNLSSNAIGWLGLTSEEAGQVQNIFSQLQDHIEGHFRATVQEIPEEDAADRAKLDQKNAGMAGRFSYYAIPPLDSDDVASLQPWLSSSLTAAIGQERADIMIHDLTTQYPWLQKDTRMLIGFRDVDGRPDTIFNGETSTDTTYLTIENVKTGEATKEVDVFSSRRVIGNAVPPELSFLFERVKDDPAIRRKLIPPAP